MYWNSLSYCRIRRGIEQRVWVLTTDLHHASERLMNLIGIDVGAFAAAKQECGELREQLMERREKLRNHRDDHHC